jgi:RNA polymerase sigma-70 factor (ECF subfamily)
MDDHGWLAKQFEEKRPHLREVAYRMLGSRAEAEDAVQEAWLRLSRSDAAAVENLGGWLTTVTARVCFDALRARKVRHVQPDTIGAEAPDTARDTLMADSVGAALLVVLETLTPAERIAFVLHDMFDLPFDEVGRVLDRSEAATRQLASRARRRVQRRDSSVDGRAARQVVDAFLLASRHGDFEALLAVLDPEVVVRADELALRTAAGTKFPLVRELHGAQAVASMFKGRARGAARATIDGEPGAVWAPGGTTRSAFVFTFAGDKIATIDLVMEPDALGELHVEVL